MQDPQITFWGTFGLLLLVGLAGLAGYYLWPTGGDPRHNDNSSGGGY